MKKYIITLSALVFLTNLQIYAQHILKDKEDVNWYSSIPKEEVFVHYNSSLLLTGEYLYYKIYCRNSKSKSLSDLSKVAYVELFNENGQSFFKHKILLENGLGKGDYFLPTSLPSGNYKIIAYTRWMLNGEDSFFASDISIINPYKGNQEDFLLNQPSESEKKSPKNEQESIIKKEKGLVINDIELTINSTLINRRTKGVLKLNTHNSSSFGNYSVSIRKIDTMITPSIYSTRNYDSLYRVNNADFKHVGDVISMPEFKGEILSGKVLAKLSNNPVTNINIALSIANNESVLDITSTNESGVFYFHLSPNYKGDEAVFQLVDDVSDDYHIELDEITSPSLDALSFYKFKMTPSMKDFIVERSINNQIQNAYFSVKPDTVKLVDSKLPFFGNHQEIYVLSDYTRFSTVNETVVEIIDHAWTRKNDKGKRELIVRGREFDPYFSSELLPIVLVDGIFVQDHEKILDYDTRKITSISVLRDEYYYGDKIYKGAISIKTIKGEFYKEFNDTYLKKVNLFIPQLKKSYFVQNYSLDGLNMSSRIPDFRHQLLWKPNFRLEKNIQTIEFFTSDVKGEFEVSIEGFTFNGLPVSLKKRFEVD